MLTYPGRRRPTAPSPITSGCRIVPRRARGKTTPWSMTPAYRRRSTSIAPATADAPSECPNAPTLTGRAGRPSAAPKPATPGWCKGVMVRRVLAVLMLVLVTVVGDQARRRARGRVRFSRPVDPRRRGVGGGGVWARSTLKSAKRRRTVKPPSSAAELAAAPGQDPVAVEMRRITEQLRVQGRG